ncbi:MAG: hypothetical protein JJU02_05460 [Cryomorphaceae bacterium]|nr:hypothetical protein [Cryomorphaceae bacterium]
MKLFLKILFLIISPQLVFSYPIPTQTLKTLIEKSQLIVIAKIDNPEKPIKVYFDREKNDSVKVYSVGGDGVANLYIEEVLKGSPIHVNHIQVKDLPGLICPTPAHYPDKKKVIAFLSKDESSQTYQTVGFSYGSKIIKSDKVLNAYKIRILEYIDIQKIKNKSKRKKATLEWLVKCSENKYTFWEGVNELTSSKLVEPIDDNPKENYHFNQLTKIQKERLENVFFSIDTIGEQHLFFTELISNNNYPKLKKHLLKNLEFLLRNPGYANFSMAYNIMEKVVSIMPNEDLQSIINEAKKMKDDYLDLNEKQIQLIYEFILSARE